MNLTEIFRSVIYLSLLGTILVIALLLIKLIFSGKLSANWHYSIWFLLILRLLIPFTPATPFNLYNLIPHYSPQINESPQISMLDSGGPDSTLLKKPNQKITQTETNEIKTIHNSRVLSSRNHVTKPTTSPELWLNWQTAALVWVIGILLIFCYVVIINVMLRLKTTKLPGCNSQDILRILEDCKLNLNIHFKISVLYDDSLKSPAILGMFAPKIIISPEIARKLSPDELRYVFLHELSHLKRRDLQVNGLILAVQIIYWFNPVIWYALRQMRQDCELACDATVLASLNPEDHKKYGQTIINLLQLLSEPYWAPGTLGFVSRFDTRRIVMISGYKKTTMKWAVAALALTVLAGCASINKPADFSGSSKNQGTTKTSVQQKSNNTTNSSVSLTAASDKIVYKNAQYDFNFTLPMSWKGFSIVNSRWEGYDVKTGKYTESGPLISIRNPKWTSQNPRQDIPIMVFFLDQWNQLQQGKTHIGAAPIGPSELGRNNNYVFALPARYNYAFPTGYKEVEKILANHPLKSTGIANAADTKTVLLLNMMDLAKLGRVINCNFPVSKSNIGDVEKAWGKADKTDYVATAKGRYATYLNRNVVFGINKGEQIFEVRSFDSRLKGLNFAKAKEVFGTPAYDHKSNNQEIIGYTVGSEFKIEMVFPQPTNNNPNPVMDHYNVLYSQGTSNSMADDPGRQW